MASTATEVTTAIHDRTRAARRGRRRVGTGWPWRAGGRGPAGGRGGGGRPPPRPPGGGGGGSRPWGGGGGGAAPPAPRAPPRGRSPPWGYSPRARGRAPRGPPPRGGV